jgi:response regulator of citrate/malate metabolism
MTTFTTEDRIKAMIELERELGLEPIPFAGMVDISKTDNGNMTQEEIAKALGVSRQTVRNIEESAFKKIRRALFEKGFNKDDLV